MNLMRITLIDSRGGLSFVAHGEALKAWANGAPLQTDDRTRLEFSGPRSIFGAARHDNAADLRTLAAGSPKPPAVAAALASATPAEWRDRGLMYLKADANRPAYDDLIKALQDSPDDVVALDALVRAAANMNRLPDAQAFITGLALGPDRVPAKAALRAIAGVDDVSLFGTALHVRGTTGDGTALAAAVTDALAKAGVAGDVQAIAPSLEDVFVLRSEAAEQAA